MIMTRQQRLQNATQPFTSPNAIPCPTKGWNSRDTLDAMDPLDAVQLDNWFPDAGGVNVRSGYTEFVTGLGSGPVETLAELVGGDPTVNQNQLIAACGGSLFQVGVTPIPVSMSNLASDGGVLILLSLLGWPVIPTIPGQLYSNGGLNGIVSVLPPFNYTVGSLPVYFNQVTATQLLALGGDVLPLSDPGVATQLWNMNGQVTISSGPGAPPDFITIGLGFSNDRWQTCGFLGRLFLCNGVDSAQTYDGMTLTPSNFTGVPLNTLFGVWQFQQRLFFWQQFSTGFWYAQLNSISGALAFYDLGAFCPRGGYLVAMTTSSYDGGNGVLDYAVFMMSSGDALLFQGNDPSLASNWSLIGEYRISPPLGVRAVTDYGGDSFITTFDDHVTLQQMFTALRLGEMAPRSKVSKAVQIAAQAGVGLFGWQALYYPRGRSLIFNVPNPNGTFDQHVCNTGLPGQPWCRYVNWNASCFSLFKNLLYFGAANGTVNLADNGVMDGMQAITATAQQAWNKFGNAQRKRVAAARPVVQSAGSVADSFALGFDYGPFNIEVPIVTPAVGSPWDTSPWNTSPWSSETTIDPRWHVGGGSGTAVGWSLTVSAAQSVQWLRTDLRMEIGNAL